jgi:hypothetical protein
MKASSQVDGANDEVISNEHGKKKSKIIKVSLQLDGTGPPVSCLIFFHLKLIFVLFRSVMMMMTTMMIVKWKE